MGAGSHVFVVAWVLPKVTQTLIFSYWNLRAAEPADLDGSFGFGSNAATIVHLIWQGYVRLAIGVDAVPWATDLGTTGTTERMSECDSTLAPPARIALQHRVLPCLALATLESMADRT